ncbi:MAG: RNA polymerase sigma factor [Myxococcota bacterium]
MSAGRPLDVPPDPDASLVAEAEQGDRSAFEALYRQHVGRVYALCARMAGDARLAEELTQRSFVRAWQRLDGFRGGNFAAWVRRIAVRVVLDERRSHLRRRQRVVLADVDGADPTSATPSARLDLERAIAELPPKARHVFVLAAVEGWTHREIAADLSITEGTSKAQLHRARALLQEVLS